MYATATLTTDPATWDVRLETRADFEAFLAMINAPESRVTRVEIVYHQPEGKAL